MSHLAVNEKSPVFVTLVFTDEAGDPLVPTTVDHRLDDKTNGAEIQDWAVLASPASTMTYTIPGDDNVINVDANVKEEHVFGVRVDDGLPGEGYSEFLYNVVNLLAVSGA